MTLTSMYEAEPSISWRDGQNDSGTALLEPEQLEVARPEWSENIAVCDIDDDLDDDEAYFLDDEDEDDDYSDDYDDDDYDDDDMDADSDDDYDDEDL